MWVLPWYYFPHLSPPHFHEKHLVFALGSLTAPQIFIVGFPFLQCSPPILPCAFLPPIAFSDLVNPCLLHLYWILVLSEQKNEKFMDLHLRELGVEWNRDTGRLKGEGEESIGRAWVQRGSDILSHRVLRNLGAPCLQSGGDDSTAPTSQVCGEDEMRQSRKHSNSSWQLINGK